MQESSRDRDRLKRSSSTPPTPPHHFPRCPHPLYLHPSPYHPLVRKTAGRSRWCEKNLAAVILRQNVVQQCRLAAPQVAGQDGYLLTPAVITLVLWHV